MINEIYCSLDPECKDPVGPVQQGTNVRFSIRLDKVSMVDSPKLVIFQIDNWEKRQSIDLKLTHISKTSNFYTCYFTPKEADVYFYYFTLYINGRYVELRKGKYSKCFFQSSMPPYSCLISISFVPFHDLFHVWLAQQKKNG